MLWSSMERLTLEVTRGKILENFQGEKSNFFLENRQKKTNKNQKGLSPMIENQKSVRLLDAAGNNLRPVFYPWTITLSNKMPIFSSNLCTPAHIIQVIITKNWFDKSDILESTEHECR